MNTQLWRGACYGILITVALASIVLILTGCGEHRYTPTVRFKVYILNPGQSIKDWDVKPRIFYGDRRSSIGFLQGTRDSQYIISTKCKVKGHDDWKEYNAYVVKSGQSQVVFDEEIDSI